MSVLHTPQNALRGLCFEINIFKKHLWGEITIPNIVAKEKKLFLKPAILYSFHVLGKSANCVFTHAVLLFMVCLFIQDSRGIAHGQW